MYHKNLTGLDLHEPTNILVENQSGSDLNLLRVVRLDGFGTARPKVAALDTPTHKAFGIVSCAIPNTKCGYVTSFGLLYNANTAAWAENAVLYSDPSGNLTTSVNGLAVAIVVKSDATYGIIFVIALGSYIDTQETAWDLAGNSGTDPAINFIGTTDLQDFVIRTNNTLAAKLDSAGRLGLGPDIGSVLAHFYQKSHEGYALSGIRQETFALTSTSVSFVSAYTVTLPDPCVARVEMTVIGRAADGSARCMFKRTGLFYREAGNVQIQGAGSLQPDWLSDQTIKSDSNLDVGYTLGVSTISLNVKALTADPIFWTGNVVVEILSTD